MVAAPLFRDTNMAPVTSRENALLNIRDRHTSIQGNTFVNLTFRIYQTCRMIYQASRVILQVFLLFLVTMDVLAGRPVIFYVLSQCKIS